MESQTENNKRLVKNTAVLYARMFLTVGISFYTSRIVLQNLGASDFGLFNLMSGFVAMFYMVTTSLSAAVNRFLAYDLGVGGKQRLNKTFCTSLNIELLFSLLVLLLGETVGLWFVNTQLVIEDDRLVVANIIYQFSLLSFIVELIGVPYFSLVVAHEKMKVFAYNTIISVLFRLAVALLLIYSPIDRLVFYAVGSLLVGIFTQAAFYVYCKLKFEESKYKLYFDKVQFLQMFSFGGWNFLTSISSMMRSQGLNIVLNICYGTVVNAAFGIARQLEGHIRSFAKNFILALNPQITKSYSEGNVVHSRNLTYKGTKFAFLLLFAIGFPIILYAKEFLDIWLVCVPKYTERFVQLTIVLSLIEMLLSPIGIFNQATGNIKKFQIATCIAQIVVLPASYVLLKLGFSPYITLYSAIIAELILLPYRIEVNRREGITMKDYWYYVLMRLMPVVLIVIISGYLIKYMLPSTILYTLISAVLVMSILALSVYFIGLDTEERVIVVRVIRKCLKKNITNEKV